MRRSTTNRGGLRTNAGIPATRGGRSSFRRRSHRGNANKRKGERERKCASLRTKHRLVGGFSIQTAANAYPMRARRKERSFAGNRRTQVGRGGGHESASADGQNKRKQGRSVEAKRAEPKEITRRTPRRAGKKIRREKPDRGVRTGSRTGLLPKIGRHDWKQ